MRVALPAVIPCTAKTVDQLISEKVMASFRSKQTEPKQTRFKTVFTIQKCVAQNLIALRYAAKRYSKL